MRTECGRNKDAVALRVALPQGSELAATVAGAPIEIARESTFVLPDRSAWELPQALCVGF